VQNRGFDSLDVLFPSFGPTERHEVIIVVGNHVNARGFFG